MKPKILVFGNPLVQEDSIALRLMPLLQVRFPEIKFKECDSSENMEREGRDLIILDSAMGLKRVELIEDLARVDMGKIYSMHDFDLSITLRLLKKINAIDSVRIIAVPHDYPLKKAFGEAVAAISSLRLG